MQIIAFIFAALLGIIAEEIIEKEVGLEKETSK